MPVDAELQEQSIHVFWHLRLVLDLSAHLHTRREQGVLELIDPLDAAALATFAISVRALKDFIWRQRKNLREPTDAVAEDWLSRGEWDPLEMPDELARINKRVGQDIAHLSYRRLDREIDRGWEPVMVTHRLVSRIALFAQEVQLRQPSRVPKRFQQDVWGAVTEWREAIEPNPSPRALIEKLKHPPLPLATPAHPESIRSNGSLQGTRSRGITRPT
jgi:hypothetical protein